MPRSMNPISIPPPLRGKLFTVLFALFPTLSQTAEPLGDYENALVKLWMAPSWSALQVQFGDEAGYILDFEYDELKTELLGAEIHAIGLEEKMSAQQTSYQNLIELLSHTKTGVELTLNVMGTNKSWSTIVYTYAPNHREHAPQAAQSLAKDSPWLRPLDELNYAPQVRLADRIRKKMGLDSNGLGVNSVFGPVSDFFGFLWRDKGEKELEAYKKMLIRLLRAEMEKANKEVSATCQSSLQGQPQKPGVDE